MKGKFIYITREVVRDDLFPAKTSMEAAIRMVMQRAMIFDLSLQTIKFDPEKTIILLHDDKNYEFVEYHIDRVVLHEDM